MKKITLDRRLMTVADFVRHGAVVADIGTDHAYLPVFLIENGIAEYVIASDVNEGPAKRAEKNVRESGLKEKIEVRVGDGLDGLEKRGITDIVICGMGGELIAEILSRADFAKKPDIRLILQPMTKSAELRRFLISSRYNIVEETLSEDGEKVYETICAEYSGCEEKYTEVEFLLGKKNVEKGGKLFEKLAKKNLKMLNSRRDGLEKSGRNCDFENNIIKEIEELPKGSEGLDRI